MKIIRYLVICFTNGDFYKIGMSDDPNEATDMMRRDVLNEMENAGYTEDDEEYVFVNSGGDINDFESDSVSIDTTSAYLSDNNMHWTIMQIDIEV